jgi:hypothetical protein
MRLRKHAAYKSSQCMRNVRLDCVYLIIRPPLHEHAR